MTVTYVQHIPNSGCWGFYRVLAKWRGSLYKVAFKQISLNGFKYFAFALKRVSGKVLCATACSTGE